jgi:hypothetical protein
MRLRLICLQSACRATLTIRNFPDDVHERLKAGEAESAELESGVGGDAE